MSQEEVDYHHVERAVREQLKKSDVSEIEVALALRDLADRVEMGEIDT